MCEMKNRMRMLAVVQSLVTGLATVGTYELALSRPGSQRTDRRDEIQLQSGCQDGVFHDMIAYAT